MLNRAKRKSNAYLFSPFADDPQPAELDELDPKGCDGEDEALGSGELSVHNMDQRLRDEFQAGFDEGRRFTEKRFEDDLTSKQHEHEIAIDMLAVNVARGYERLQEEAEQNVVKLALAIAQRIVKRELAMDDEIIVRQIHEATRRVIGVERIKIRVNPKDEECVRQHRTKILATTDAVREVVIEEDETIERGGCIVESDAGNVDALIATQLERIEAAMLGDRDTK